MNTVHGLGLPGLGQMLILASKASFVMPIVIQQLTACKYISLSLLQAGIMETAEELCKRLYEQKDSQILCAVCTVEGSTTE